MPHLTDNNIIWSESILTPKFLFNIIEMYILSSVGVMYYSNFFLFHFLIFHIYASFFCASQFT